MNTTPRSRFGALAVLASVFGMGPLSSRIKESPAPAPFRTGYHPSCRYVPASPPRQSHGISNVRAPYFQPCWKRDGFKDSASYVEAHRKARKEHAARLATA